MELGRGRGAGGHFGWKCSMRRGGRVSGVGDVGALECDHIQPVKNGGSQWERRNLQALCRSCHIRKTREEKHVSRESGLEIVSSGVGRTDEALDVRYFPPGRGRSFGVRSGECFRGSGRWWILHVSKSRECDGVLSSGVYAATTGRPNRHTATASGGGRITDGSDK